jgi:hypothetical protein
MVNSSMKTKMIIAVLAMLISVNACASPVKINVHVSEEDGRPVANAKVKGAFNDLSGNTKFLPSMKDETDERGNASISGEDYFYTPIWVEKNGYYESYIEVGLDKSKTYEADATLRVKLNPIPLYAKTVTLEFPQRDYDYEFDFFGGDLVSQGGAGSYADVKIRFIRNLIDNENFTQTAILTFASPTDGVVEIESKDAWKMSEFKTPYLAAIDGYKSKIELKNARSLEGAFRENLNTPFFVRLRSEVDSDGKIKTANYCKIFPGIELFGALTDKPLLRMTYYCNPNLNDRNLEFDPQKNLFKDLKVREQVRKP